MKTVKLIFAVILVAAFGITASAQATTKSSVQQKTETFKVFGKCDMCKTRIEKTVKAEGATSADWNTKSEMLTVTFDPSKTSVDALGKKLASVGHDTEKYKAPNDVYAKLPGCLPLRQGKIAIFRLRILPGSGLYFTQIDLVILQCADIKLISSFVKPIITKYCFST